ncbi:MAG: sugar ABC transporter permease, partial [Solobacterium sp.]|nr:sugar ABC transporter permease [Solobacterium sp.]
MAQRKAAKASNGSNLKDEIRKYWWLFLLPVVAAFLIGFVWPFFQGIYLSFCSFKTTSDATLVGLSNYSRALSDP